MPKRKEDEILIKLDTRYRQCYECGLFYNVDKNEELILKFTRQGMRQACVLCRYPYTINNIENKTEQQREELLKELRNIYPYFYTIKWSPENRIILNE